MDWASTIAVLATATSFACQLIGLEICFTIVRKGSTTDIAPAPFVAFFVSACVWLKYGLMMNMTSLILTSVMGSVLQFLYICVYYVYTSKKNFIHRLLMLGLVILFTPLIYVDYYEQDAIIATTSLGLYCCGLSILCYASPLATVSEVFRYKSTESVSFPLCVINFISAVEWTLYGVSSQDNFVIFPNMIGGCFGVIQLSLFWIYGFKKKKRPTGIITNT